MDYGLIIDYGLLWTGLRTMDYGLRGLWTVDCGTYGPWTMDYGPWTMDPFGLP